MTCWIGGRWPPFVPSIHKLLESSRQVTSPSSKVIFIAFFSQINRPGGILKHIQALTWLYAYLYEHQPD